MNIITKLPLLLIIVGGLNWGLVGAFNFDIVSAIFGQGAFLSRAVFVLVGLSAAYEAVRMFVPKAQMA